MKQKAPDQVLPGIQLETPNKSRLERAFEIYEHNGYSVPPEERGNPLFSREVVCRLYTERRPEDRDTMIYFLNKSGGADCLLRALIKAAQNTEFNNPNCWSQQIARHDPQLSNDVVQIALNVSAFPVFGSKDNSILKAFFSARTVMTEDIRKLIEHKSWGDKYVLKRIIQAACEGRNMIDIIPRFDSENLNETTPRFKLNIVEKMKDAFYPHEGIYKQLQKILQGESSRSAAAASHEYTTSFKLGTIEEENLLDEDLDSEFDQENTTPVLPRDLDGLEGEVWTWTVGSTTLLAQEALGSV